jgi:hypothetical protein
MLGCHDFCGYYEWTFHYLRRRFGREGLEKYWAQAIAADAQQHYIRSGRDNGLRGLYESWFKTGIDEQCEWTVTLDEKRNLLRLDMRECPSKGFLLKNDLNADEDYCDHCMGWIGPALNAIGAEVAAHEHNHCGQCWWEMRMKDKESVSVELSVDIRKDLRWNRGYLDRFTHQMKSPAAETANQVDPCETIRSWFEPFDRIMVLGDGPLDTNDWPGNDPRVAVIVSGRRYADGELPSCRANAVILEHGSALLPKIEKRYAAGPPASRPLLLHPFLPGAVPQSFAEFSLPRPLPILPLLIRAGLYVHRPHAPPASWYVFAALMSAALRKDLLLHGIAKIDLPPQIRSKIA